MNETIDASALSQQTHTAKGVALGHLDKARQNLDQTIGTSAPPATGEKPKPNIDFIGMRQQLVAAVQRGEISMGDLEAFFNLTRQQAQADTTSSPTAYSVDHNGVNFVGSVPVESRPNTGGGRITD